MRIPNRPKCKCCNKTYKFKDVSEKSIIYFGGCLKNSELKIKNVESIEKYLTDLLK